MENPQIQPEDEIVKAVETGEGKIEGAERSLLKNKWVQSGGIITVVGVIAFSFLYWQSSTTRIGIDNSLISAPLIDLSPTTAGQLQETYVNVGDMVPANTPVAKVGDEIIKTQVGGEIVTIETNIGKSFNPGQAVVSMIDPSQLRVVGTIDENKGLSQIHVGQLANFTVDAFGSKTFSGVVDEVSPTSRETGVLFNISDKRPTQQFDIKVRFNQDANPELKKRHER